MWAKVAEEMSIPWRAVEAMHWQLGEHEMARRAGVIPFSLAASSSDNGGGRQTHKGHAHTRSQGSIYRDTVDRSRSYSRNIIVPMPTGPPPARSLTSTPRRSPTAPQMPIHLEHGESPSPSYSHAGGPLAPIQPQTQPRPGMLPGLAELTTGVSPYSTPAYSVGIPHESPAQSSNASPGPFLPALPLAYPPLESPGSGRRSLELSPPDAARRRHPDASLDQSIPRHMP